MVLGFVDALKLKRRSVKPILESPLLAWFLPFLKGSSWVDSGTPKKGRSDPKQTCKAYGFSARLTAHLSPLIIIKTIGAKYIHSIA